MPCSESIAPVTHMDFCLFMFCEQYSTLEMHRSETLAPVAHVKSSLFVLCEQYSALEMQRSQSLAPVTQYEISTSHVLRTVQHFGDALLGIPCARRTSTTTTANDL